MSLDDSSKGNGDGSGGPQVPLDFAGKGASDDETFPEGSRWQAKRKRRDGQRAVLVVVAAADDEVVVRADNGVEYEIRKRSLIQNYDRIGVAPPAIARPTRETALVTVSMKVSPTTAQRWLDERNPDGHNRPLDAKWVRDLSTEIADARWRMTHQGVCFSFDGKLKDGQHRLSACVLANKSIWVRVSYVMGSDIEGEIVPGEAPEDVQDFKLGGPIDCGKFRPAYVQRGLQDPARNFAREKRIQGLVGSLDVLMGRHERLSAGHIDAIYARHSEALEWAVDTFPWNMPVAGPAALAFASQAKETRKQVHAFANIIVKKAFSDDKTGCAYKAYELMCGVRGRPAGATRRTSTSTKVPSFRQDVMKRILRLAMAYCEGQALQRFETTDKGVEFFTRSK